MELGANGKSPVDLQYLNVLADEKLAEYFDDLDDLELVEALHQESMFESLQLNAPCNLTGSSSRVGSRLNNGCAQSLEERDSSRITRSETQIATDEALARELQELEHQLADTSVSERAESNTTSRQSSRSNGERSSANSSSQAAWESGVNIDDMSYEELQRLGEALGIHSRGLTDELISLLPCTTYKTGLFSNKDNTEECVICYMAFKNREKLIKLPCKHLYHKGCIAKWLKINKACPVCQEEVFGSK